MQTEKMKAGSMETTTAVQSYRCCVRSVVRLVTSAPVANTSANLIALIAMVRSEAGEVMMNSIRTQTEKDDNRNDGDHNCRRDSRARGICNLAEWRQ